MFTRATLLHLRIPFSFFLLPIYLFALVQLPVVDATAAWVLAAALHLCIYPASNAYNSYMDRDEGSIGGLRQPPPITPQVYHASIVLDTLGVLLGLWLGWPVGLALLLYLLVSKAYSWHGIRLKKFPVRSHLVVACFQGGWVALTTLWAVGGQAWVQQHGTQVVLTMLAATLLVGAVYPLTQIYQHDEDARRGDRTISRLLGIRGTFVFSAALFATGGAVMGYLLYTHQGWAAVLPVTLALLPVLAFFHWWLWRCWQVPAQANFTNTMRMNLIASLCLSLAFLYLLWQH